MKQLLKKSLIIVKAFATKKVMQQFAHKFELVYFGAVNPREDEHELVRGITLSSHHKDNHYMVGNFRNHDITVVERFATLASPGKPLQKYHWLVMQIDLQQGGFPHVFLDANHYEEVFYANFFAKMNHFENALPLFVHHDLLFTKHFKVFARRSQFDEVWSTIQPDIAAMLAHHFKQFDFELEDERLFVYACNPVITMGLLQEMLRVSLWLADQLNTQKAKRPIEIT